MENNSVYLSIVMPCLNEEQTIGVCVKKALSAIEKLKIHGEVVISDNGSTDRSMEIAESLGARVVHQPIKGYGAAYIKGLMEAKGKYIIMGDSDNTYDFSDIEKFVRPLEKGYDFVMGTRLKGKILPGAMSWSHRYIGNPFLSWFLNLLFHLDISDSHCGMRAFSKDAFRKMHLQTTGMEFASEMVINASKAKLKTTEVPITYYPREGKSKLRSIPDAWRHMRFMLLYSPTHLFLVPGIFLMILGLLPLSAVFHGPIEFAGRRYDNHFMILSSMLSILGFQIISLGLYAKAHAFNYHIIKDDKFIERFYKYFTLERGIYVGLLIFLIGFSIDLYILIKWINRGFGALNEVTTALLALTLIVISVQIIFSSFLLSLFEIKKTIDN